MTGFPTRAEVEEIRRRYPKGTFVVLRYMDDAFSKIPEGTAGIVLHVDDAGTVHTKWENGSTLGFIVGVDRVEIIEKGSEADAG